MYAALTQVFLLEIREPGLSEGLGVIDSRHDLLSITLRINVPRTQVKTAAHMPDEVCVQIHQNVRC